MRPTSAFPVQGKLLLKSAQLEDWSLMLDSRNRQQTLAGLAFVSPWLVGLALLFAYPFLASLAWSFCRYDLLSAPSFVGLEHYQRLAREIVQGDHFGQALWNTAYYALLSVPLSIMVAMGLAIILFAV